jgi:hypothetical protein
VTDQRQKPTIFCMSTYEKGQPFLREAARLGCNVVLLTLEKHLHGDWPRESLTELITMPENLMPGQVLNVVLREHTRLPGMGESDTRYFRDKLAMRVPARKGGIPVPEFSSVSNLVLQCGVSALLPTAS